MRYLTVHVRPTEGGAFHPLGAKLAAEQSVGREAIHHVELVGDGTVLMLAEGSGDRARYEEIMSASPYVLDFLVSGGERWVSSSHFDPRSTVRDLLRRYRESDVVMEMPIDINDDGSLTVTYLGSESDFRDLFYETTEELPLGVEVVETGDYDPETAAVTRGLTTRQQEVLEAAVDVGYYRVPRQGTHEDVADALDIAPTTVGDHLRKIEARVFGSLAR
jgi:predicted DNA binding protein